MNKKKEEVQTDVIRSVIERTAYANAASGCNWNALKSDGANWQEKRLATVRQMG